MKQRMTATMATVAEHSCSMQKLRCSAEQEELHSVLPDLGVGLELDVCAFGQCCTCDCHQAAFLNQEILHHLQSAHKPSPARSKMMCTCMML